MIVFGATEKASKTALTYVDKHNTAHCHICQLKDEAVFDYGDKDVKLQDISGEYVHLLFCKKESLETLIKQLNWLLEWWKKTDEVSE